MHLVKLQHGGLKLPYPGPMHANPPHIYCVSKKLGPILCSNLLFKWITTSWTDGTWFALYSIYMYIVHICCCLPYVTISWEVDIYIHIGCVLRTAASFWTMPLISLYVYLHTCMFRKDSNFKGVLILNRHLLRFYTVRKDPGVYITQNDLVLGATWPIYTSFNVETTKAVIKHSLNTKLEHVLCVLGISVRLQNNKRKVLMRRTKKQ